MFFNLLPYTHTYLRASLRSYVVQFFFINLFICQNGHVFRARIFRKSEKNPGGSLVKVSKSGFRSNVQNKVKLLLQRPARGKTVVSKTVFN